MFSNRTTKMKRNGVSTTVQMVSIVVAFLIGLGIMYAAAPSIVGAKTTTTTVTSTAVSTTTVTGSGGTTTPTTSTTTTSSAATSTTSSGGTIDIGLSTFLSGGNVQVGTQQVDGAKMAINEINAAGGVLGKQLNLITQDEARSQGATGAVNILVQQDHVQFLLGPFYSGEVQSVLPTTYSSKVVQLLIDASLDGLLTPPQNAYMFMVNLDDNGSAYQASQWLQSIHASNYLYVAEDYIYAHEVGNQTAQLLSGTGITAAGTPIFVPGTATDYSSTISTIISDNPSALVVDLSGTNAIDFAKQYSTNPVTSKIPILYIWSILTGASYVQSIGSSANMTFVGFTSTITNKTASFNNNFQGNYGISATPYAYDAYDAVQVLALAIEKAGTTNTTQVAAALEQTNYVGPGGHLQFTSVHGPVIGPDNYQGSIAQIIYHSTSTFDYEYVWPPAIANATAVNPATGKPFT